MIQLHRIFQLLCRAIWSQPQTHPTCVLEIAVPCEMAEDVLKIGKSFGSMAFHDLFCLCQKDDVRLGRTGRRTSHSNKVICVCVNVCVHACRH